MNSLERMKAVEALAAQLKDGRDPAARTAAAVALAGYSDVTATWDHLRRFLADQGFQTSGTLRKPAIRQAAPGIVLGRRSPLGAPSDLDAAPSRPTRVARRRLPTAGLRMVTCPGISRGPMAARA